MPKYPDQLTNVGDVITTSMEGGDVRLNLGNALTSEGVSSDSPLWANGHAFVARPANADPTGACEAQYLYQGNQIIAIATRDARYAEKAGELQPGDAAIVTPGEARLMLKTDNDSVTIYTTNQTDSDSSMLISVIGEAGKILIANGSSYIEMQKDKIVLSAGGAMLVINGASGAVEVYGKHFAANTGGGNLGVVGGIAPPIGAASVIAGVSGIAGAPSTKWTVAVA